MLSGRLIVLLGLCALGLLATGCRSNATPQPAAVAVAAPKPAMRVPTETVEPVPTATRTPSTTKTPKIVPAFPGAEGFGAQSIGGRGGRVIEVRNLNDSGPGSLRACAEATGPRICVFRVAGIIELEREIQLRNPYLTIAGQTAPGGGITIRAPGKSIFVFKGDVHDVVIRYLRLRAGNGGNRSRGININIGSGYNIIVDHISSTWAGDKLLIIYRYPDKYSWSRPVHDITVQRSLFAEILGFEPTGFNIKGDTLRNPKQRQYDKNGIPQWYEVHNISLHHNLFAHIGYRNPNITAGSVQVVNNVIYNWGLSASSSTRKSAVDWIGNYYKPGPMTNVDRTWGLEISHRFATNDPEFPEVRDEPRAYVEIGVPTHDGRLGPSIYVAGNVGPRNDDPSADNWSMTSLYKHDDSYVPKSARYAAPDVGMPVQINGVRIRRDHPLPQAPIAITVRSAHDAYESLVDDADVGANARLDCLGNWVPNQDAVDERILNDVRAGTGPSDPREVRHENDVGGYPEIDAERPCPDSDHDGMPDAWERKHGFDPGDSSDEHEDADRDGYTNVEEYLNGTVP